MIDDRAPNSIASLQGPLEVLYFLRGICVKKNTAIIVGLDVRGNIADRAEHAVVVAHEVVAFGTVQRREV